MQWVNVEGSREQSASWSLGEWGAVLLLACSKDLHQLSILMVILVSAPELGSSRLSSHPPRALAHTPFRCPNNPVAGHQEFKAGLFPSSCSYRCLTFSRVLTTATTRLGASQGQGFHRLARGTQHMLMREREGWIGRLSSPSQS